MLSDAWTTLTCYKPREIERPSKPEAAVQQDHMSLPCLWPACLGKARRARDMRRVVRSWERELWVSPRTHRGSALLHAMVMGACNTTTRDAGAPLQACDWTSAPVHIAARFDRPLGSDRPAATRAYARDPAGTRQRTHPARTTRASQSRPGTPAHATATRSASAPGSQSGSRSSCMRAAAQRDAKAVGPAHAGATAPACAAGSEAARHCTGAQPLAPTAADQRTRTPATHAVLG